jgi:hypothetical protein
VMRVLCGSAAQCRLQRLVQLCCALRCVALPDLSASSRVCLTAVAPLSPAAERGRHALGAANRRGIGRPFSLPRPLQLPSRVGPGQSGVAHRSWTLSTPCSWHACFIGAGAIILHLAPRPEPSTPLRLCPPLTARRVHVEPRSPDIEESSEFPRTPAGQDGIRQGRNVPSPPPHAPRPRADHGKVRLMCSSSALGRLAWEPQSACTRLYAQTRDCDFGGASAKLLRTAPHG